jgi:Zn-dependent peptidase ImmA (M78 family)
MKSKIKLSKAKPKEFPKLMSNKQYDFMVLFEKKNKGVVVYNQEEDKSFPYYDVGHHSEHWVMDRFEDFNGKLTLKN